MNKRLKNFFAAMAGVDPSQIEVALDDDEMEDFDEEGDDFESDAEEAAVPDFMERASNVYRTKEFIVKQEISLAHQRLESAKLISSDTYYARTPERDALYERIFRNNKNLEGKRVSTMAYFRSYRE